MCFYFESHVRGRERPTAISPYSKEKGNRCSAEGIDRFKFILLKVLDHESAVQFVPVQAVR